LRSTEIATWDGPVVTIPNSTMAVTPVVNYTVNPTRRIKLVFSIAYGEDIDTAIQALRDVIEAEERHIQDKGVDVYVSNVREYAIELTASFHAPNADWFAASIDTRRGVLAEFQRCNIALAVPVRKTFYMGQIPTQVE